MSDFEFKGVKVTTTILERDVISAEKRSELSIQSYGGVGTSLQTTKVEFLEIFQALVFNLKTLRSTIFG